MKKKGFKRLLRSVKQGAEILAGKRLPSRRFEVSADGVKSIRHKLKLSQSQLANALGISKATLQNWEQGRRKPKGAAAVLLRVAEKQPEAVKAAIAAT
jgi:putative transcriptional regulator